MEHLEGRVAVVTGAGSGIGRGMVRAFAAAGMRVVAADVDRDGLDATVAGVAGAGAGGAGAAAIAVPTDVTDLAQVRALAEAARDHFGRIDVVCNNAGVGVATPTDVMDLDAWRWVIDIDLWGVIHGVKVFLPLLEANGEGHLNATASMAGLLASEQLGAYNVAKHGVVALMATVERELRGRGSGVRASVLCPGAVNTGIVTNSSRRAAFAPDGHERATRYEERLRATLAGGMDPDEVGRLVLDAVRDDRFWVLTHPPMAALVRRQVDAITADGSLTRL